MSNKTIINDPGIYVTASGQGVKITFVNEDAAFGKLIYREAGGARRARGKELTWELTGKHDTHPIVKKLAPTQMLMELT